MEMEFFLLTSNYFLIIIIIDVLPFCSFCSWGKCTIGGLFTLGLTKLCENKASVFPLRFLFQALVSEISKI